MYQTIMDFPEQFLIGYKAAKGVGSKYSNKKFDKIIVAGMGGSALTGDLLFDIFYKQANLKIPSHVHRDYNLPKSTRQNTLVIIISYSGNTKETLSVYQEAKNNNLSIITITSGGKLKEYSKKDNVPSVTVPGGIQPRMTLGYQLSALVAVLENANLIDSQKNEFKKLSQTLDPNLNKNDAEKLAKKIGKSTPIFYSSYKYKSLSYILKIQINENSKRHAFFNIFPELNHNEIEGYEKSSKYFILILRGDDDDERIQKYMKLTKKIIEKKGHPVTTIDIKGKNVYNKVYNTILFGNWLSYYLAIQNNIDPTPVNLIEEIKKQL